MAQISKSNILQRVLGNKRTSLAGAAGLLSLLADHKDAEFFQQAIAYLQTLDWHTALILILSTLLLLAQDGPILKPEKKAEPFVWPKEGKN